MDDYGAGVIAEHLYAGLALTDQERNWLASRFPDLRLTRIALAPVNEDLGDRYDADVSGTRNPYRRQVYVRVSDTDLWSQYVREVENERAGGDITGIFGIRGAPSMEQITTAFIGAGLAVGAGIVLAPLAGAAASAGGELAADVAGEAIADTVTLDAAAAPIVEADVIYPEVELAAEASPELEALPELELPQVDVLEPLDAPGPLQAADAPLVEENVTFPEAEASPELELAPAPENAPVAGTDAPLPAENVTLPGPELELAPPEPSPIAQVEPEAIPEPEPLQAAADAPLPEENVTFPEVEASPELELTPEPDGPVAGTDAPMPAENVALPAAEVPPMPPAEPMMPPAIELTEPVFAEPLVDSGVLPTLNSPLSLSSLASPLVKKLTAAASSSRSSAPQASPLVLVRSAPIDPPEQAYGFAPTGSARDDAGAQPGYGIFAAAVLSLAAALFIGR